jgi:O-antigen/teichoic acid export membrane protein
VFAKSKDKDKKEYYAQVMKYFVIFTLFAYLCVVGWMPLLQRIIEAEYRVGLDIVPIVMAAEIMMGIYFNLSFWYKLIDKTIWGAWFSLAGCTILIAINVIFIPEYSYEACAWGGVAGYGTAMVLSYAVGRMKYPIDYDIKGMLGYVLVTVAFYYAIKSIIDADLNIVLTLAINSVLILAYLAMVVVKEKIRLPHRG